MGRKCAYCGIPELAGADDEVVSVPGDRLDKEISFEGGFLFAALTKRLPTALAYPPDGAGG